MRRGYRLLLRCRFYRVKIQDRVREHESERDGKKRRVRLVTLCRANFGTVLENFSLAAYRGKLGEISTWPIVLHYGSDEVRSPLARGEEMCIFGWDVAKLTFAQMSYMPLYIAPPSDKYLSIPNFTFYTCLYLFSSDKISFSLIVLKFDI